MRTILRDRRGMALPIALGFLVVLSISLVTVLTMTQSNEGAAKRANASQQALDLAEAAVNRASALLFNSPDPYSPLAVGSGSEVIEGGTSAYSTSLSGNTWTLTGTGTFSNPVAGGGVVTRTASQQLSTAVTANSPWYYNFSDDPSGCLLVKKDGNLTAPLFIRGSLCLNKDNHLTGSPIEVGGTVTMGSGATIGYPGTPVAEVRLLGGCTGGSPDPHACSSSDGVYASSYLTTSLNLTKPPVDLPYWYQNAKPGPLNACTTGSVPGGFDTDSGAGVPPNPNASLGTFSLGSGGAFDCRVTDAGGNIIGRLSWTPGSPGTLFVAGTTFFDGSINVPDSASIVYQGRGTIYASGSINFGQYAQLCGVAACDGTWNTATNMIGLVAGAPSGDGLYMEKNSVFQGAAYLVADFRAKKDVATWGPIIANQFMLDKDGGQMVPPASLPPGVPGINTALKRAPGGWQG